MRAAIVVCKDLWTPVLVALNGLKSVPPLRAGPRINAVKRLAVSTGQLRQLPALHIRPIDLVVFQEPVCLRTGDLVLGEVSRLDAFSVYPSRT